MAQAAPSAAPKTVVDANPAGAAAAPPKKSKLVIGLVVLNVLALAGVGGYFALAGRGHAGAAAESAAAEGEGEGEGEGEASAGEGEGGEGAEKGKAPSHGSGRRGPIVPLESIITNLVDDEELHFLKVTVQLEAKDESAKTEIQDALVPVRDRVLLRLSSLTLPQTQGAEKKAALQAELVTMINAELGARRVTHVYFTEFVVQ
jgi:flagellar FliL protein